MVTRKSSIPAPSAPPPPPPAFGPPQPDLHVDSGDVPAISSSARKADEDSPYQDMGNPWAESNARGGTGQHNHPEILRPGLNKPATGATIPDIPDILKPGWSGENTPRSSIDDQEPKEFWESSDDEEQNSDEVPDKGKGKAVARTNQNPLTSASTEDLVIPPALHIKRKPVGASPVLDRAPAHSATILQSDFASNNPFRRATSVDEQPPTSDLLPSWDAEIRSHKEEAAPVNAFGNLSLASNSALDSSTQDFAKLDGGQTSLPQKTSLPPQPQSPPPPIPVPQISSPFSEQPPLIPVSPKADESQHSWSSHPGLSATPSPIPFAPSQKQTTHSTDNLLDRGQKADGRISLGDELRVLPNAAQNSSSQTSLPGDVTSLPIPTAHQPLSLKEEYAPPPGPPPSHRAGPSGHASSPPPPMKPPRPAVVTKPLTDAEIAQLQEQRNETYQIKHFNWFDHRSGNLRTSSMLTQNKNGPCPLLALVNALILGAKDESQAALDNALRSREQVSLGLIIETLMDELLSSSMHIDGDLPDVDELNRFLMKLRTGMNMNPRFVQPQAPAPNLMDARNSVLHMPVAQSQDQPGDFESTQDLQLYGSFGIKTVHGWLPEPGSEVIGAFKRSAQNYEEAQVVQFGEEELDYKLSHSGLTPQEQRLWEDIVSIKNFFRLHPTQLTAYGLSCINRSMQPGSFAILFRNDHFSTIYKHPRDGKLYTLITDAGYAERDEIIWESLVDISGQHSEFFSGDFQSVSHGDREQSSSTPAQLAPESNIPEPLSPQQQQEQHDADYAMALALQEEEEQQMRQQRSGRAGSSGAPTGRGNGQQARRGQGQGIPIPLRANNAGSENRPLIPPRNQRASVPAVNRPSDSLDPDAPPSYEEAARGKPYNPPVGSPLHPQSSANAEPSPYGSISRIELDEGPGDSSSELTPALRRPQRRQSAYNENYERYGNNSPRTSSGRFELGVSPAYNERNSRMPGTYIHTGRGGHGQGLSSGGMIGQNSRQRRDDNGECLVM